jgi:hypothetical protein
MVKTPIVVTVFHSTPKIVNDVRCEHSGLNCVTIAEKFRI